MKSLRSLAATVVLLSPLTVFAQSSGDSLLSQDSPKVTITSRGNDVRLILTNMFSQAKKSFILQPNVEFNLYLSMQDCDFKKALDVICAQANLKYDVRDDIYHIYKKRALIETPLAAPVPKVPSKPSAAETKKQALAVTGKLPISVFKKKVTTKLAKTPISKVLEQLGEQAGVKIEMGENVPAYKMDAFLSDTTLRYALEQITKAAKLTYTLTDHKSILVEARS